jgi:hypothetical protein
VCVFSVWPFRSHEILCVGEERLNYHKNSQMNFGRVVLYDWYISFPCHQSQNPEEAVVGAAGFRADTHEP